MTNGVHPALILILGAFLFPFLPGRIKQAYLLVLTAVAFIAALSLSEGTYWVVSNGFLGHDLVFGRVDRLSLVFSYIFTLMGFIATLFGIHMKDDGEKVVALIYGGCAVGVSLAGDMISLFIFLELMMLTATYLVWAKKSRASYLAGFRYFAVHALGGLCLLAGILLHFYETGSIAFDFIGLSGLSSFLIFIGFGVNCAFPLLHAWLPDAYPESTITGTVFLATFTTKSAVYLFARAFPGTDALIYIGAVMTAFPIFIAVIENNLRRVLCYSLINQVGFMIVAIGIGTELAINGAVAHAFVHILYKGLLFMSMGAVIHQTGKINATDLGGLYKSMPFTAICCIIGAASISGFPLTSGFVTKSMIVSAAGHEGLVIVWFTLIFAAAGVFHHSGIKIPFFAFFSHDSGIRTTEPPLNMRIAMGIAAFLCIFIGVFPSVLYSILPYPVDYVPYTTPHVVAQLQLLLFSALAFTLLLRSGIYPAEIRAINIDTDWFYRKGTRLFLWLLYNPCTRIGQWGSRVAFECIPAVATRMSLNPLAVCAITVDRLRLLFASEEQKALIVARIEKERRIYPGDIIRSWPIGSTVLWVSVFLLAYLLIYYL